MAEKSKAACSRALISLRATRPDSLKTAQQIVRRCGCHQTACELSNAANCIRTVKIKGRCNRHEVARVNKLDDDGPGNLACEKLLPRGTHTVANNKNVPIERGGLGVSGSQLFQAIAI